MRPDVDGGWLGGGRYDPRFEPGAERMSNLIKGNAVIGQSGGPTAVINASLAGVIDEAHRAGFLRVLGMRYGILGALRGVSQAFRLGEA